VSPEHEANSQRKLKLWLKLHYYHGNIIRLFYCIYLCFLSVPQNKVNFRCELASASGNTTICCIVSCQWQHNKLLWVKYDNTTIFLHRTPRHNVWLCRGVLCGNCCVVKSQNNNSLCCDNAIIGNTKNCCVAGFCVACWHLQATVWLTVEATPHKFSFLLTYLITLSLSPIIDTSLNTW